MNFTALPTRLTRIWRSRSGVPKGRKPSAAMRAATWGPAMASDETQIASTRSGVKWLAMAWPCLRRTLVSLILLVLAANGLAHMHARAVTRFVESGERPPSPASDHATGTSVRPDKATALDRLHRLNQSEQFLFGEQFSTLWGMYFDGHLVSTNAWFDSTARAGRFTSDSEALVGDHPAVLGVSLQMLAFEPAALHRRTPIAQAIQYQFAKGGLVTMDWHAPSCTANVRTSGQLGMVKVDGRDVVLQADAGGALFYAEEEYAHAIESREDVPEALKCLCLIANDAPLTAGPYQGMSGKTWLVAHAKQAATVMREEGLADLPIIVRPFHEHNGAWFWWGMPYWNCAALLDKPDAVSGPEAYKTVARTFVSTLRDEPGMGQLLFAYSPDRLFGPHEQERFAAAQKKVMDPMEAARERLRERLARELRTAGLAYESLAKAGVKMPSAQASSARAADADVAQRRHYYTEAYAGDDVFDVLGIDLYHPIARPANDADLHSFRLQLRALAEEARARQKPYAWTEAGTLRLQLLRLASQTTIGRPLQVHSKDSVERALARLFDPSDRAALLRHYQLTAASPVSLSVRERSAVVPQSSEDWYGKQLLVLAKETKVAYALVWQTYYDSAAPDRDVYYFVPYPGHPEAASFQRFHADPATCFLRDGCAR